MMDYGGMNAAWWIFCTLATIAIIALMISAVMNTTNRRTPPDGRGAAGPETLALRERRFAKGKIDNREYQRPRQLLTQH